MTATFLEAMDALAAAFTSIPGLSTYANPPGVIEVPALVVSLPSGNFADYNVVLGGDAADLDLVVNVFVQWGDDEAAWDQLVPFVSQSGPYSLFAAVNADPTLGGVVDSALIGMPTNAGPYTWGAVKYLGAEMPVELLL
jgi:hypothetical protein